MICLDCEEYNFVTERCYKIGAYIPSTSEGIILTCMHFKEIKKMDVVRNDQAIWWGADEHDKKIQWYLCQRCGKWFKDKFHHCSSLKKEERDFIEEKEMKL